MHVLILLPLLDVPTQRVALGAQRGDVDFVFNQACAYFTDGALATQNAVGIGLTAGHLHPVATKQGAVG